MKKIKCKICGYHNYPEYYNTNAKYKLTYESDGNTSKQRNIVYVCSHEHKDAELSTQRNPDIIGFKKILL